ncbi:MAG: ferredoxin [Candidatus Daviesbacteria bacterium]|nr:ferredoxin [Candidatus Daviesbacteria bacterium]
MSQPKITINRKTCISCGTCVAIAPKTFELDDKMIAVVKSGLLDNIKTIQDAASSCAVSAITVEIIKD